MLEVFPCSRETASLKCLAPLCIVCLDDFRFNVVGGCGSVGCFLFCGSWYLCWSWFVGGKDSSLGFGFAGSGCGSLHCRCSAADCKGGSP